MDLADVLWLCGATGSGKSSIARERARHHDLQLYNIDHRTWIHSERANPVDGDGDGIRLRDPERRVFVLIARGSADRPQS